MYVCMYVCMYCAEQMNRSEAGGLKDKLHKNNTRLRNNVRVTEF